MKKINSVLLDACQKENNSVLEHERLKDNASKKAETDKTAIAGMTTSLTTVVKHYSMTMHDGYFSQSHSGTLTIGK